MPGLKNLQSQHACTNQAAQVVHLTQAIIASKGHVPQMPFVLVMDMMLLILIQKGYSPPVWKL